MKSKLTALALMAAAAAFLLPPKQARAGDDGDALIGGLIGGLIIGAVLADDHVDAHVSVGYGHRGHGHWKWVTVKRWVPGYYERSCDRYGRPVKVWVSGHYTYVKRKVWVDRGSSHCGHRDCGSHCRHHGRDHWDRHDPWDRHDRHDRWEDRGRDRHHSRFDDDRFERDDDRFDRDDRDDRRERYVRNF